VGGRREALGATRLDVKGIGGRTGAPTRVKIRNTGKNKKKVEKNKEENKGKKEK
jgi:hypothetical protein